MLIEGPIITDDEMAEHRADAESRMTSRALIGRRTGARATAPSGAIVDAYALVCPDPLPARLRGSRGGDSPSRTVSAGDAEVQVGTPELHLPRWVDDVQDGDVIHIVSGERTDSWWLVVEGDLADQQTATRLPVVATTKPEGWPL